MRSRKRSMRQTLAIYSIFYLLLILFISTHFLYAYGIISADSLTYLSSSLFSLMQPFGAISYMMYKGLRHSEIRKSLGFVTLHSLPRLMAIGILLFLSIFVIELAVGEISAITGAQINTNAGLLISGAPLWFIIFICFIAPINEEIFFRGFLVPRFGILLPALLFGFLHAGYGSSFGIEIIAASIFGILAGYIFKRSKSLYPSIIAHMLVNILAVVGVIL